MVKKIAAAQGYSPQEVLEQSVERGGHGVFLPNPGQEGHEYGARRYKTPADARGNLETLNTVLAPTSPTREGAAPLGLIHSPRALFKPLTGPSPGPRGVQQASAAGQATSSARAKKEGHVAGAIPR